MERALSEARRAVETSDELVRELEQERTAKEQTVNGAREQLSTVRLNVREVQVRAETVAEQFARTGFVLDQVTEALPSEATVEAWEETLEKLDRRIQRMGPHQPGGDRRVPGAGGAQGVLRRSVRRSHGRLGHVGQRNPENRQGDPDPLQGNL